MIKVSETNLLKPIDKMLVNLCDFYGYKAIAVSCIDDEVLASKKYNGKFIAAEPDLSTDYKGKTTEGAIKGIKGWPAIWKIVDTLGGCAGSGSDHHSKITNNHPYSEVSYRKIDGEWYIVNVQKITKDASIKYGL